MAAITIFPHNCGHVTILSTKETSALEAEFLEKKAWFLDIEQCESCKNKVSIKRSLIA